MVDDTTFDDNEPREFSEDALTELSRRERLLRKFERWDKELDEQYGDWQQEARECFRFVAGEQYERDELDRLKADNKPHAVFNRIGPIIDAVVGAQINGRQEVKFFPREVGDSMEAEVLSKGADWLRECGDADSEESMASRDCFICGVGVIETLLDFDEDPEGKVTYSHVDPTEVLFDPASVKPNYADARYVRREKIYDRETFKEMYPGVPVQQAKGGQTLATYSSDPKQAYNGSDDEKRRSTDVSVRMYQWYDIETVVALQPPIDPITGIQPEPAMMSAEDFYELQEDDPERFAQLPPYEIVRQRKYRYATVGAGRILDEGELGTRQFTLQAQTGKRDKEKGVYYGLVRAMKDPQQWANTFFNMTLHLMRTNAKGGVMVEAGAVNDMREFQASWSASDSVNVVENGALQNGRIQQKPLPGIPAGLVQLMDQSVTAIREVSGVSPEVLGLADREQAGVLEVERKRTVYGILAQFFDSFRRYRKMNGALLIEYMRQIPGQLVRVTDDEGMERVVPLALDPNVERYDIIVSEAPDGPHQKQQVFGMLQALLPLLMQSDLGADAWAALLKYTPLPSSLVAEMAQKLTADDPEAQQEAQVAEQERMAELRATLAKAEKDRADAAKKLAEAQATAVESANVQMFPDDRPQVNL